MHPLDDTASQIQSQLQALCSAGAIPGVSVTVSAAGEIRTICAGRASTKSDHPITDQSRFPIACIAKLLIAILVLEEHVSGRLDINAPVDFYLARFRAGEDQASPITLKNLLSHTGGYEERADASLRWSLSETDLRDLFLSRNQVFPPGAAWSYTHTGYVLLAEVLETVNGSPVNAQFLRLFERLFGGAKSEGTGEMVSLHLPSPHTGAFEPSRPPTDCGVLAKVISYLHLSTTQVALLGQHLIGLPTQNEPGLARAVRDLLFHNTVHIPTDWRTRAGERTPTSFGLGIGRVDGVFGHTGTYTGSTMALYVHPARGISLAIAVNARAPRLRDRIAFGILQHLDLLDPEPANSPARSNIVQVDIAPGQYRPLMLMLPPLTISDEGEMSTPLFGPVQLRRSADGGLQLLPDDCIVPSLGLFAHPDTGKVALRVGYSAYALA